VMAEIEFGASQDSKIDLLNNRINSMYWRFSVEYRQKSNEKICLGQKSMMGVWRKEP